MSPTEAASPRVLVLYAGGTVGMEPGPDGYRPMPGFADRLRERLQHEPDADLPAFDLIELERPIDSANLSPTQWQDMAGALLARWDRYTGFVLLHGTDTMAWSASALSFMLQGTEKPVIFTGSQIPLLQPRSDAPGHLQAALRLAAHRAPQAPLREVGLLFGRHLWRGNRSRKLQSQAFDAFGSPNALPLADIGIRMTVHAERLLAPPDKDFRPPVLAARTVAVLSLHPGIDGRTVDALLDSGPVRGLLLCSYGVGNAPDDRGFLSALERASARGVAVMNTTQCVAGSVAQGAYATGAALSHAGVVPGADITPEAAFAKLHVLLGRETDPQRVREWAGRPLCGEMGTPAEG